MPLGCGLTMRLLRRGGCMLILAAVTACALVWEGWHSVWTGHIHLNLVSVEVVRAVTSMPEPSRLAGLSNEFDRLLGRYPGMRSLRHRRFAVWLQRQSSEQGLAWEAADASLERMASLLRPGDARDALEEWDVASSLSGHFLPAYALLTTRLSSQGVSQAAGGISQVLEALEPMYYVGQSIAAVSGGGSMVSSEWRILGYDLWEPASVGFNPRVGMTFYWEASRPICPGEESAVQWMADGMEYLAVGNRVYQWGTVDNLAPDAGFEADFVLGRALPSRWPYTRYSTFTDQVVDLTEVERGETTTTVLRLHNVARGPSGLSTLHIRLPVSDTPYLLVAWVRTLDGGKAYVTPAWYNAGPAPAGSGETYYQCVVCGQHLPAGWNHKAGTVWPPSEAEWVMLWLDNLGMGTVLYDDILFVPLTIPVESPFCDSGEKRQ